jgi:hemolysin activation/secretion protein
VKREKRPTRRLWPCFALVAVALAVTGPLAKAQRAPDAGSILRQQQPPVLDLPVEPFPALQTEQPARPPLQAPQDLHFALNGWRVTGQTVFTEAELLALIDDDVGLIGLVDLEEAAARVSRHYREHGYVVARAYIPAQEIRDGIVEIAVLEGRIGRVIIENRSRVRDGLIASRVDDLEGQLVREESINLRLRLTHDLEGIGFSAPAALQPGTNVGETDLVLPLESGPLVTGSLELDNHGNRYTGGNRLSGQIDIHGPTRSGDLLSLRGTVGDPDLGVYNVLYELPAGAGGLRLGGDLARVRYRLGRDFSALEAHGTADTWLGFVSHPLTLGRNHSAHARLSYRQSDIQDRIDSTGTVTDKSSRLSAVAITGDWHDAFAGGGATAVSLSYGRGDLDIKSLEARAIDDATARTQGGFWKWNMSATRLQRLTERASLYLSYASQKAQKNLDSSEKFILGGPYGIKAYPEGEAPGDAGYILNVELRYDLRGNWIPGRAQLLAFVDTGAVTINESVFASGPNRRELSSAGLGLSWVGDQGLYLRLIVAHQLGNEPATSDTDQATRGWLQAFRRF